MITTLLAVGNGIAVSNIYSSLFSAKSEEDDDGEFPQHYQSHRSIDGVEVEFVCPKSFGKMTVDSNGNVICVPVADIQALNLTEG